MKNFHAIWSPFFPSEWKIPLAVYPCWVELVCAFAESDAIIFKCNFVLAPIEPLALSLCDCTVHFVFELVGNPEDRFSCNAANIFYEGFRFFVHYENTPMEYTIFCDFSRL